MEILPLDPSTRLFDLRREPTILEIADAEKYSDYTELVRFLTDEDDAMWAEKHDNLPADAVYRFASLVRVVPYRQRFSIWLRPGAGPEDLAFAREQVAAIKAGHFHQFPWRSHRNAEGEWFGMSLGEPVRLSELAKRDERLEECAEPACIEPFHALWRDEPPMHIAEQIQSGKATIQVVKYGDEAAWSVYTDFGDSGWEMAPNQALSLANDLRWAAATVAKLNAPEIVDAAA